MLSHGPQRERNEGEKKIQGAPALVYIFTFLRSMGCCRLLMGGIDRFVAVSKTNTKFRVP